MFDISFDAGVNVKDLITHVGFNASNAYFNSAFMVFYNLSQQFIYSTLFSYTDSFQHSTFLTEGDIKNIYSDLLGSYEYPEIKPDVQH